METVIYLDTVLFYNVLADHLLLLAAGRLAGLPLRRKRIFAAALLGGGYAVLAALPAGQVLRQGGVKLLAAAGMVALSFGKGKYFLRRYLLFLLVSGAFAGAEMALADFAGSAHVMPPFSLPLFLGSFAICWLGLGLVFRGSAGPAVQGKLIPASVTYRGCSASFAALADSGCALRDPLDGRAVLVAELSVLRELFTSEEQEMLRRGEAGSIFSLRELPFRSLGGAGVLPAFRAEEIRIGSAIYKGVLVAVHAESLGGETFHALWGGEECSV